MGAVVTPVTVQPSAKENMELLWQWAKDQDLAAFQIWGADFVYDYPPVRQQILDSFHSRKDVIFLRFLQEGQVVGLCELTEPADREHTISRLILSPEVRGRGVGTACLKELSMWAASQLGDQSLRLVVYDHNDRARRCYEKNGFYYVSHLLRPGKMPAWEMRKKLCIPAMPSTVEING